MLAVLIATAVTSLIASNVRATPTVFNNAIQEEPEVECGQGTITVRVRTSSQKPSFIFAKGHFHKDGCHFKQTNNATFPFEQCNINRKREVNPRGMAYSLTVIVQLHPLFITKVDRAYNVRCFYMEENKEVDATLQVSDLTTYVLESGHAMPQCSYTLHRDSPNGPVLRYARVGDVVFHVWDCPSDVYAMLIHTCFILDGQGGEHKVIDENGCSTDDFIIPKLTYSNELTRSFTGASVVNLPDRESIYFSCQVKLCFKKGDYCTNVTPPRCDDQTIAASSEPVLNSKHIEDDLRNDQLLYTTAGPLATSKTVRIVPTAPPPPNVPASSSSGSSSQQQQYSSQSSRAPTHGVTINTKYADDVTAVKLPTIANNFPTPPRFMEFLEGQSTNFTDFTHDFEGSGEDDFLPSTIATNSTTSTGTASAAAAAANSMISSSAASSSSTGTISSRGTSAAVTTAPVTTTREPNPTRGRRTVPESDYNIVDLDVTTPQLKILEEGFDLPDLPTKTSSLSDRRDGGVCIPVLSMWLLSGISLVSVAIAIATIMYSRLASRKIALFYRY